MFEKLIWISTYMLVGTAKDCSSVGQAGNEHKQLVEDVITELIAAVSAKEGISFTSGAIERLAAYTDVVADFPCGVKEFEWRNQVGYLSCHLISSFFFSFSCIIFFLIISETSTSTISGMRLAPSTTGC